MRNVTEPLDLENQKSPWLQRALAALGPGFVTGASDDDPSGVATYAQAGAAFGLGLLWTMLLTFPLMASIQIISARIGATTGRGIAGNIRRFYPRWTLYIAVVLLFGANVLNVGTDIGAMAEALHMLVGGSRALYIVAFAVIPITLQIYMSYARYVRVLKWLTLVLFAYVGTAFVVPVPWHDVLTNTVAPSLAGKSSYWSMLIAILGTTISPYLFFWQASEEVESNRLKLDGKPLRRAPKHAAVRLKHIRTDTMTGMAFSNIIGWFIILSTAVTLFHHGVNNIETATQAAKALEPIAGHLAYLLFAVGIIGTGLLAIPVLCGSAAYAVGEAFDWPVGLGLKPGEGKSFYLTIAVAGAGGIAVNFLHINVIRALVLTAIINGVVAIPIMALMMLMASNPKVMGRLTLPRILKVFGWLTTAVMLVATIGMFIS